MGKYVCITGVKFSGKDSFAYYFEKEGYVKVNFADNLKEMCAYAFSISLDIMHDPKSKEIELTSPAEVTAVTLSKLNEWISRSHSFTLSEKFIGNSFKSIRKMLQFVGTDMIRATYENYHVEVALKNMEQHNRVVCADCRFMNELEGMRDLSTKLGHKFASIYMFRPGYEGDSHISENSIKEEDCNTKVYNDTTVENLSNIANLIL